MSTLSFAKRMMMSQEIKANNTIEGINDDLSLIDDVIKNKKQISNYERKRIINLYHGYQYILTHKEINKDNLKELYNLLSDGLLTGQFANRMGEYYRNKPVYICKKSRLDVEPFLGVNENKVNDLMNQLFEFINDKNEKNDIDVFIKSQIMHFYFVYIHPYPDVNGRTSRTVAMWYLLNNKVYPYIIFNRAIAFSPNKYENNIILGREKGNITMFLKYMLKQVLKELEKEYIISNIVKNSSYHLTKEERQMIEYMLSMNGGYSVKDLAKTYNNYNTKQKIHTILDEKIKPLIEKEIFTIVRYTKSYINSEPNMILGINKDMVDIDKSKVKHINLDKFI